MGHRLRPIDANSLRYRPAGAYQPRGEVLWAHVVPGNQLGNKHTSVFTSSNLWIKIPMILGIDRSIEPKLVQIVLADVAASSIAAVAQGGEEQHADCQHYAAGDR